MAANARRPRVTRQHRDRNDSAQDRRSFPRPADRAKSRVVCAVLLRIAWCFVTRSPRSLRRVLARVTTFAIDGLASRRVTVEVDLRHGLPAFTIVGTRRCRRARVARARACRAAELGLRVPAAAHHGQPRARAPAQGRPRLRPRDGLRRCSPRRSSSRDGARPLGGLRRALARRRAAPLPRRARGRRGRAACRDRRPHRPARVRARGGARRGHRRRRRHEPARRSRRSSAAARCPRCLRGPAGPASAIQRRRRCPTSPTSRGHAYAIRALTIAAAGAHNLLLSGAPGTGKTMLARRLPSILPPLSRAEAIAVTRIHSIAGAHIGGDLVTQRPLRAPHHTISASGIVGGGTVPSPGEASLAHHGVLFLDELSEFSRSALEALRQPLEDGVVAIVRGQRTVLFPTRFQLIASTNPCPCGLAGDERCSCSEGDIARHRRKLSGPLLDRLDLLVHMQRPTAEQLGADAATTLGRGARGRCSRRASDRRRGSPAPACRRTPADAAADPRARRAPTMPRDATLRAAYERGTLSARGHQRILRVARTIADLDGSERVHATHVERGAHAARGPDPRRGGGGMSGVRRLPAADGARRAARGARRARPAQSPSHLRAARAARRAICSRRSRASVAPTSSARSTRFDPDAARERVGAGLAARLLSPRRRRIPSRLAADRRCARGAARRRRRRARSRSLCDEDVPAVAIVGARRAGPDGLEVARGLGARARGRRRDGRQRHGARHRLRRARRSARGRRAHAQRARQRRRRAVPAEQARAVSRDRAHAGRDLGDAAGLSALSLVLSGAQPDDRRRSRR